MGLRNINSENRKILDLSDQHKNPELWFLFDLVPVYCFTNRLTQTPNVFIKNVYSSLDKFDSTPNTSKSEIFILNYYKISERHVGISLGENKYYYIKKEG